MNIYLNGKKTNIEENLTLQRLLESFQINPGTVVVERNESILPRDEYEQTWLREGDKIEVVRFVGGGI